MRMMLRCATQYRASFLLQTLGQLIMTAGDLMAVLVLMNRFAHVGQWQPDEILVFFGVMQLSFSLTECFGRGITSFDQMIRNGQFDCLMLRPRSLLLQVVCSALDPRRLITSLVGLAAVWAGFTRLGLSWSAERVILLVLSVTGGTFLLLGLFLIAAVVVFFSVRSIEMLNVLTYGGRSACQYPADIYPGPLRVLFTWVAPFVVCMQLPVSVMLGKPLLPVGFGGACAAPLMGVAFFLLMSRLWYVGARHYRSTGS